MRISLYVAAAVVVLPLLPAQTVPATAPTVLAPGTASAQTQAIVGRSATVTWNRSELSIDGRGDTLRGILRQVARTTGMKVTGGVPDEPVFGSYGPGSVQEVLAALFNGLSVNVMLVNGSPTQPKELLLTARTGGATPPQTAQPLTLSEDPAEVNLAQPQQPTGRHNSPNSFQRLPDAGANATGPPVPLNDTPVRQTTDASGTPQSPNGTRTPEQIFDELRRRQQGNTVPQ